MMPGLMRQREGQSFDTDLSVSPEPHRTGERCARRDREMLVHS